MKGLVLIKHHPVSSGNRVSSNTNVEPRIRQSNEEFSMRTPTNPFPQSNLHSQPNCNIRLHLRHTSNPSPAGRVADFMLVQLGLGAYLPSIRRRGMIWNPPFRGPRSCPSVAILRIFLPPPLPKLLRLLVPSVVLPADFTPYAGLL